MGKPRIPTKPSELRDVLKKAFVAVTNTVNWPTSSPPAPALLAASNQIDTLITQLAQIRDQEKEVLALLADAVDNGAELMKGMDYGTDALFGPDSEEKNKYGVPPKKSTATPSVPLEQVVITKIQKGRSPKSIFVDWDIEEGAGAYQVEVYIDSALTQIMHSASVTNSEYKISGLVQGQQYWVRVCAVRGSEQGPWSDVATEVAGI